MKTVKHFSIFCVLILFAGSCSDVFEKSIANQTVTLIAPGNKDTSSSYSQTFYWNAVPNALKYEVQIVSPDFVNIKTYIDTTVTSTRFSYTLSPGRWVWHVRALNGSSQTNYSVSDTLIISTTSLAIQSVSLTSPANNTYSNNPSLVTLNWQILSGASMYKILIDSAGTKIKQDTVYSNQYNLASLNLNNGVYTWDVTGISSTGDTSSIVSPTWTFLIDNVLPDSVTRKSPVNKYSYSTSPSTVTFSWTYAPGSTASYIAPVDHYILTIYQSSAIYKTMNVAASLNTTALSLPTGTYTWNIQVVDMAGNISTLTNNWSFLLP
jgi:hypothetical protein